MAPGPDRAWFFKLSGPVERVEPLVAQVLALYESVRFEEAESTPDWQMPETWTKKGSSEFRFETIVIPAEGGDLEISVTGLALTGDWPQQLLANLNRWRGQLMLPAIEASRLEDETVEIEGGPEGAVVVDLRGWMDSGSQMPPMMNPQLGNRLPPAGTTPPISRTSPAPAKLDFDKPEGWVALPSSGMRVANLRTSAEDDAAEITVTKFARFGAMGDLLENVNRWRGQVELGPTTQEEAEQQATSIEIAGEPATLVELYGENRAMLAAMAPRGDVIWFFKLWGGKSVVEGQRDAYLSWIESVRFEATETASADEEKD